jgi:hypothetical protein
MGPPQPSWGGKAVDGQRGSLTIKGRNDEIRSKDKPTRGAVVVGRSVACNLCPPDGRHELWTVHERIPVVLVKGADSVVPQPLSRGGGVGSVPLQERGEAAHPRKLCRNETNGEADCTVLLMNSAKLFACHASQEKNDLRLGKSAEASSGTNKSRVGRALLPGR